MPNPNIQGVKIYYGQKDNESEEVRIAPAPQINISYTPVYANDNIINIIYKITLNGFVSSWVQRTQFNSNFIDIETDNVPSIMTENIDAIFSEDNTISTSEDFVDDGTWTVTNSAQERSINIREIVQNIDKLKRLLQQNGSVLTIKQNNDIILTAIGGVLKKLSFDTGSTNWTQTVPFTAELEFNYINFFNETFACSTYWNTSYPSGMVDMNKYPIKSFNDNWSIIIGGESFNNLLETDMQTVLNLSNTTIALSYNISAVGKDYYTETDHPPKFKPAWEIAKHFVQERMYDKVTSAITGILNMSSGCLINDTQQGLITPMHTKYGIFNETINCSTSEIEGTFSLSYNSILKKKSENIGAIYDSNDVKHTITKNITHSRYNNSNTDKTLTTININGKIEGLIRGGLIQLSRNSFSLPRNGSLLLTASTGNSKYQNALLLWNNIKNLTEDDINNNFKDILKITDNAFDLEAGCGNVSYPLATSFTLTRNIIDGIIDYDITYDNNYIIYDQNKQTAVQNIVIQFTDKVPVFAEFTLPAFGVILQDLNTFTAKEFSITITGRNISEYRNNTAFTTFPSSFIHNIASRNIALPSSIPLSLNNIQGSILKNRSFNCNAIDGTYSMEFVYVCNTGCSIV